MNSWLRTKPSNPNPIRLPHSTCFPYEVDEDAAFNSFVRHWQQITEIFDNSRKKEKVSSDDVTAVLNYLGQMVNLLLVDVRRMTNESHHHQNMDKNLCTPNGQNESQNGGIKCAKSLHTPIFDHFLGERVLQTVLQWSKKSGSEYFNLLQLEIIKVFETILSNSHPEILVYKPITEPLINLLEISSGCIPVEVEKRLIVLLNQLWVSLVHNQHLLKYFLQTKEDETPRFLIFSLLLPFVHREGSVGQQARDTLLLSMTLSSTVPQIADYIVLHSNFCPVLAAGLSGLYSMLPRSLNIRTEGWYRISSEDVASTPSFQLILSSLGFCNAIVQSAHEAIQEQLVDYLYQGFLVPVVGPALIQMNVIEEIIASLVYLEFFIQSVSEEKLRRAFLALLLSPQEYSELPLLTAIISHLHSSNVQLNLVALNLFHTLIQLHSEDLMIALVFQYLTPCTHVMISQRSKLSQPPYFAADRFLNLLPSVCQAESLENALTIENTENQKPALQMSMTDRTPTLDAQINVSPPSFSVYLKEAERRLAVSRQACSTWAWPYDAQNPLPTEAVQLINAARLLPIIPYAKPGHGSQSCSNSLPYEGSNASNKYSKSRSQSLPGYSSRKGILHFSYKNKGTPETIFSSSKDNVLFPYLLGASHLLTEDESRLDSLGESSGYESIIIKGSRDSSPLHINNRLGAQSDNHNAQQFTSTHSNNANTILESSLKQDVDNGFLQFLDQSDTPVSPAQCEDDLEFIEDFYNVVGENYSSHKPSVDKEDEAESDLQSLWFAPSSSTDEDSGEDSKELLSQPKPTIGPFLEALVSQIDNLLSSNTDVSMLTMSCISSMACYPCPILISLLLQPSVVLQPAVRSLYQVLSQLKQKIDKILPVQDVSILVDGRLKFHSSILTESSREIVGQSSGFARGADKRRSFSQTVSNFFKRSPQTDKNVKREILHNLPDGSGYRYINSQSSPVNDSQSPFLYASIEKKQAAICAILLQEWLLELAALAEEHTVSILEYKFHSSPNSS